MNVDGVSLNVRVADDTTVRVDDDYHPSVTVRGRTTALIVKADTLVELRDFFFGVVDAIDTELKTPLSPQPRCDHDVCVGEDGPCLSLVDDVDAQREAAEAVVAQLEDHRS